MLIIKDQTGQIMLDISQNVFMYLGTLDFGGAGAPASGTLVVPEFTLYNAIPSFRITRVAIRGGDGGNKFIGQKPNVSISGNNLNWSFTGVERPFVRVLYGLR